MELKIFRNKYDLELIPAASTGIILGNLVWDSIFDKPKFSHPGMTNNIFNAFLDAKIIDQQAWNNYLEECKNVDLVNAAFAETFIDVDVDLVTSLDNPKIGKLGNQFDLKNIRKFTFSNLQARVMTNLLRVRIDEYLEILKKDKWNDYDGKVRRVYMITELYYGSIKIVIDRNLKDQFEGAIPAAELDLKGDFELQNSIEYAFNHKNVPFSMRIEKIKNFNS